MAEEAARNPEGGSQGLCATCGDSPWPVHSYEIRFSLVCLIKMYLVSKKIGSGQL